MRLCWICQRTLSPRQLQQYSAVGKALAGITDDVVGLRRGGVGGTHCCVAVLVTGAIHATTV